MAKKKISQNIERVPKDTRFLKPTIDPETMKFFGNKSKGTVDIWQKDYAYLKSTVKEV